MTFLPKAEVLTLEELDQIASAFIGLGVRKLRLTGGEPLVRKGFMGLVEGLSRHLKSGALDELTLTTNGTRLSEFAGQLASHGVKRLNVSIDTLNPDLFREGSGVVAEGHFNPNGSFTATNLLAKHDEKYMPPAVAGKMHETKTLKP